MINIAWDSVQASGTIIDFDEWNAMVTAIKAQWCSGSYNAHKIDTTIHFTKTSLDDDYAPSSGYHSHITNTANPHSVVWSDVSVAAKVDLADDYYPSSLGNTLNSNYTTHSNDSTIHFTKSSLDDDYYPSSLGNTLNSSYAGHSSNTDIHFPSSQMTSWFDNLYSPSGAASNLSQLTIDVDKDWNSKGIHNISYISSQSLSSASISSGHISTDYVPVVGRDVINKTYADIHYSGGGTFLTLTDTPSLYTNKKGKQATVNASEDGLEFMEIVCNDNDILIENGSVVWA